MQFVSNGPDIPERLLQRHEEERVVFFCGAGISYPAKLPGFSGLVKMLYDALEPTPSAVQQAAIKARLFDTAIGLLEADIQGGRERVRRELARILTPDLSAPKATATHEALLTLSKTRSGQMRLITTNFDRLFEDVIISNELNIAGFYAPLLPVPKNRWDGLVYLHGVLPANPTKADLDRLVVSSGDFGLAYLTERWAARFISDLFRGYTVCFVGYSINDPVLRYMMDALAADRLLGESTPEMFAFGSYSKGQEKNKHEEWAAKNVTPILYREHNNHVYLHKTLRAWAEIYRNGILGKERIVAESAIIRPQESTKQDDFVGRMLWALSDKEGLPAKRFAELNPVPTLDWLEPLSQKLFGHADLNRFGVPPLPHADATQPFSLLQRPAPYTNAAPMALLDRSHFNGWDKVMGYLADWLVRHLDDPNLLLWLVKEGGRLDRQLTLRIEIRLNDLAKHERDGNKEEIERIRRNAPNAIPRPAMRTLWRLLLTGRTAPQRHNFYLTSWCKHFNREGLTASLRLALREGLSPYVALNEPYRLRNLMEGPQYPERISQLVRWEVTLSTSHVHSNLRHLAQDERWIAALPELLGDFTTLLRDALDLMHELGSANSQRDYSNLAQPSIAEHSQNRDFHDWTALINLTRDAWLATATGSPAQARIMADAWANGPYPLFRRLALFAAAQGDIIQVRNALDYLLNNERWWLWSVETRREAIRLLIALAPRLDAATMVELEDSIIAGPARELFAEDATPEELTSYCEQAIWLRLAKLAQADAPLSAKGQDVLNELSAKHPEWQLEPDQRDEFPFWMGSGWVGDRNPWQPFRALPRDWRGIKHYLLRHPQPEPAEQKDWLQLCTENFRATACALSRLVQRDLWPVERWQDVLQAWSGEGLRIRSWRYMAPVVLKMPVELLATIAYDVSWWLQIVAKNLTVHEEHFFSLALRVLLLDFSNQAEELADDVVFKAINHPIGHTSQALLNWWLRQELDDGQLLPSAIKPIFSDICDNAAPQFRHGRVMLAAHVITLFRVDEEWTKKHLLPHFNWKKCPIEAQAAWEGFLWSPRIYLPLMSAFKDDFLLTAHQYARLGKHQEQYASLLTFVALEPLDLFTKTELVTCVRALPPEGLRAATEALARALEGAGEQREVYWRDRVQPLWDGVWPQAKARALDMDPESLARLCIAAGNEFPSAVAKIGPWLRPIEHADYIIGQLDTSGLCGRFPAAALRLLDVVLSEPLSWKLDALRKCLDDICAADPELRHGPKFMRIDELARRSGA